MKKFGFLVLGIFLLGFLTKGDVTQAQGERTSLWGHVYGVITIPKEEMERIPREEKSKKFAKETFIDFKDGSREMRVGVHGWTVSVGNRKVLTDENGEFFFPNLPAKQVTLLVSFKKTKLLKQKITLHVGEENYQDVVLKGTLKQFSKSMAADDDGYDLMKKDKIKCLDHNYYCGDIFHSDCFKSIRKGNGYCLYESLYRPSKDDPGRWCNRKDKEQNCSPYIGHKQKYHCDYVPW